MKNYEITECPRDAMQGIRNFIPTQIKIEYLNLLLQVGFDVLDCGSFVSARAIPQMQDTPEIIPKLNIQNSITKLLCIVANKKGAEQACGFEQITYLGFPFSISEEFQKRNTNSSREESLFRVEEIQKLCYARNKKLVVYLSMAFGNPYGEPWNPEILVEWAQKLKSLGVSEFRLADTIGCSDANNIRDIFSLVSKELTGLRIGVHLHSSPQQTIQKISSAWQAGCTLFDSALLGFGGCPMAKDELTGNISTELLLKFLVQTGEITPRWNQELLDIALQKANAVFLNPPHY